MAVDVMDQAGDAALEIWSPETVISGVRRCLDAYRQAALNLTTTNLASIFRAGERCNRVFQLDYILET